MVPNTLANCKRISEKTIRRLIKFKEYCCDSCHEDMDNGYPASELDEIKIGYTKSGEPRYAEICCMVAKAFNKWREESKRNLRKI